MYMYTVYMCNNHTWHFLIIFIIIINYYYFETGSLYIVCVGLHLYIITQASLKFTATFLALASQMLGLQVALSCPAC